MSSKLFLVSLIIAVVAVSALPNTPAFIWSNNKPDSTQISFASFNVIENLKALTSLNEVNGFSAKVGDAVFLFVENDMTMGSIKNSEFILPEPRIELPHSVGVTEDSIVAELPEITRVCSEDSFTSFIADMPIKADSVSTFLICTVDTKKVAQVMEAAKTKSIQFIGIYASMITSAFPQMPAIKDQASEQTVSAQLVSDTTYWPGSILSGLFCTVILIMVLIFGLCLMFSLQTQVESEAPKVKTS